MFQLNVEILHQYNLDKWRQTHMWRGYMTLMIADLRGFWLNKWKFNSIKLHQCWDSSAIWFGPMPSNRHMERIPDTHDSHLDYQVWSKCFDFTKGNSILSSYINVGISQQPSGIVKLTYGNVKVMIGNMCWNLTLGVVEIYIGATTSLHLHKTHLWQCFLE